MNAKSPHHLATLVALLALTGVTASIAGAPHGVAALLVLAAAKLVLVAFRFMDLRHAHLLWKAAIVVLCGGTLTAIGVLAAG